MTILEEFFKLLKNLGSDILDIIDNKLLILYTKIQYVKHFSINCPGNIYFVAKSNGLLSPTSHIVYFIGKYRLNFLTIERK